MEGTEYYRTNSKMFSLICQQPQLLQMMSRFGIPLGVGDKTIEEVCDEYGVHAPTFTVVANYIKFGAESIRNSIDRVSVTCLMEYLRRAHRYFLDFQLPMLRRKLLEAIICTNRSEMNRIPGLIVKFFDEYANEVRDHMEHENNHVFSYVDELLQGHKRPDYSIEDLAFGHKGGAHDEKNAKIDELKSIIIKYYKPDTESDLLNSMMYDIFALENDMFRHSEVENDIFVPAVRILEETVVCNGESSGESAEDRKNELSEREKEIVGLLVQGLRNKEIADKLCISIHTVQTHRKNISRKLNIHSVSGLTIYALVNNIATIE